MLSCPYPSRCFQQFSFKIKSNRPVRFSWLQPNAADDMACLPLYPSSVASTAFLAPADSPLAATAAVSASPTLATELPSQAVLERLVLRLFLCRPLRLSPRPFGLFFRLPRLKLLYPRALVASALVTTSDCRILTVSQC